MTTNKREVECHVCGGALALMGQLGSLLHFRCVGCGMDHSMKARVHFTMDRTTKKDGET